MTLREPLDLSAVLSDFDGVKNGQPGAAMTDEEKRARDAARTKAWQSANQERVRANRKDYYQRNKARYIENAKVTHDRWPLSKRLLVAAKARAKKSGAPFSIKENDVVVPEICPVLQVPLVSHKQKLRANSPSLDRIDNTKGYVAGNVQVISHRANILKRDATFEEIEALYLHMKSLRDRAVRLDESGNRT